MQYYGLLTVDHCRVRYSEAEGVVVVSKSPNIDTVTRNSAGSYSITMKHRPIVQNFDPATPGIFFNKYPIIVSSVIPCAQYWVFSGTYIYDTGTAADSLEVFMYDDNGGADIPFDVSVFSPHV